MTVGGSVTGLLGSGLVLQDNGGDDLTVAKDGTFTFATAVASGAAYAVTVKTQPSSPSQDCKVLGGTGTTGSGNVTSVAVNCSTNTFTVSGSISGLSGGGLVLQNNGGDDLSVTANGTFAFATPIASGGAFAVTVKTQPTSPAQTCTVTGDASGTIGNANVSDVAITCTTNKYTIGGTVVGLSGSGMVLQNNGGDDLAISGAGAFTFATSVASGSAYAVTVKTQPSSPPQTCTVSTGSGNVGNGNVSGVVVNCLTNAYTIGGSVSGLGSATGLVLQDNNGDDLAITADGAFTFTTPVTSGNPYAVTVKTNPTKPWETCTVTTGTASGTVASANVTTVEVTCTTNLYTVSVAVTGLAGSGLILQNNGADDLPVASDGTYPFATQIASGSTYNVTVSASPSGPTQTCTVTAPTDTMAGANVTLAVSCVTNSYGVNVAVSGLTGTGLVLQNNGADDLSITSNGTSTFATQVASGAGYSVTIKTQASGQICSVASGAGTIVAQAVTVNVSCINALVASTTPVVASGSLSCSTVASNTGRKVAVDPVSAAIYVAMDCGGTVYVSSSTDRGSSFGTPVSTGIGGLTPSVFQGDTAIAVGSNGSVYVGGITAAGALYFTRSTDGGATWATPNPLETGDVAQWGVHVSTYGNNVYVSARNGGSDTHLWRNAAAGVGAFQMTVVTMNSNVFGDALVDQRNGDLWVTSDDATFHLRHSTDGGQTFAAQVSPGPAAGYSTWSIGNGKIFATGETNALYVIPVSAPTTSTTITGFTTSASNDEAQVAADDAGNAYVAAQTSGNTIALARVIAGTTAIADTRTLGSAATFPGVVATGNNACVVVYTQGTQVMATVQKY